MTALQLVHAPQPGHLTINEATEDFVSYLVVERNCPGTTIRAYRQDLEGLSGFLGDKAACDVTMSDLRAWLESLHGNYAASTIGRKLACVRSFFRFGKRERWARDNPARELDLPRRDQLLPHVLSVDEVDQLIAKIDNARDRALVEVMYGAGLRVSELVSLDLEDVGSDHVKVMGKGGRERVCPIGRAAIAALRTYLDERGDEPGALFLNYRRGRLTDRSVRRILRAAGLDDKTTPHTLRHSYATHLLDSGADVRSVQELLGHQSITSTQMYTHVSTARKRDVYTQHHPRA